MAKFFVTYGVGGNKRGCYSVIDAESEEIARSAVLGACGRNFAFLYDEQEFAGQVEKWGLKEAPLGPQVLEGE